MFGQSDSNCLTSWFSDPVCNRSLRLCNFQLTELNQSSVDNGGSQDATGWEDLSKQQIVARMLDCSEKERTWCVSEGKLYTCTQVPGVLQTSEDIPAAHGSCLPGYFSYGVCSHGQFLCLCEELQVFSGRSWGKSCSSVVTESGEASRTALLQSFSHADYRLGNILDRWYSVNLCHALRTCDESTVKKLSGELRSMTSRAPVHSFAYFLMHHTPRISMIPKDLNSTFSSSIFAKKYDWFWIYFFPAVSEVSDSFSTTVSHSLQEYVKTVSPAWAFRGSWFDKNTCVVHYRLGDMLSHSHFLDPQAFAEQIHLWILKEGLKVDTFHLLTSGSLSFRANPNELIGSHSLFQSFVETLKRLFPSSEMIQDDSGSPDEDWFKMVAAPMLATSHGSYAISAAMLNTGYRASPALEISNFPGCGSRDPGHLLPRWYLFLCRDFQVPLVNVSSL